ncbi:MAG: hypothetical protein K2O04_03330 [Clostridiales bacterium]|nr:hypothetical protein [Clostridiales bacterium]
MENKQDKFVTMIGFARRSGKIVYGLDSLKSAKNIKLLAVSDTASDNLKRNMELIADKKEIPIVTVIQMENALGNNVKALGLTDTNMAKAVVDYIETTPTQYTIKYGIRR